VHVTENPVRIKGLPIPANDLWIAALALRHSLAVVTRDKHFEAVEGLTVVKW
jgi:tRNA(fMet)-specific endonuclease VapC